jgi:hypothetical protein
MLFVGLVTPDDHDLPAHQPMQALSEPGQSASVVQQSVAMKAIPYDAACATGKAAKAYAKEMYSYFNRRAKLNFP